MGLGLGLQTDRQRWFFLLHRFSDISKCSNSVVSTQTSDINVQTDKYRHKIKTIINAVIVTIFTIITINNGNRYSSVAAFSSISVTDASFADSVRMPQRTLLNINDDNNLITVNKKLSGC